MNKEVESAFFKFMEWYGIHMQHRGQYTIHDKLQKLFNLNINKEFKVTRSGAEWVLNPSDYVHRDLFWFGIKDMWDMWHIKKIIKPESTIFDVGSNFGYYSISIALELNRACKIYSFEPFLPAYERLVTHISLNNLGGCIIPYQLAISDKDTGSGTLSSRSDNSGASYIVDYGKGDIQLTSLDFFCSSHNINKVDLIKIDVEGFEFSVLKGAQNTVLHSKPIIFFELNPPCLERNNLTVKDLVDLLIRYNYFLYTANRKRLVPLVNLPSGRDYINVFAMPK